MPSEAKLTSRAHDHVARCGPVDRQFEVPARNRNCHQAVRTVRHRGDRVCPFSSQSPGGVPPQPQNQVSGMRRVGTQSRMLG